MQKKSKFSIMCEEFFKIFWGPQLKKYTFFKTKGFFFSENLWGRPTFSLLVLPRAGVVNKYSSKSDNDSHRFSMVSFELEEIYLFI